jgi:uncharacterized GH25 family protein
MQLAGANDDTYRIEMLVSPGVSDFLQNFKRSDIARIEESCGKRIIIRSDENVVGENYIINCYDNRDRHITAPDDAYITQTLKADSRGVFTYAMPVAGWWGFAALSTADFKMEHRGKMYPVEIGAVLWVMTQEMK